MVLLATFAGLTALMRLPIGPLRENAGTRVMSRAALDEAHAVARAKGIGLPGDFVERTLAGCDGLPYEMKSSMLQDLERGRRLELPWLSGTIARLGQELGIPTLPMPSSPPHSSCMRRAEVDGVVARAGVPTGNRTRVFALKAITCIYADISGQCVACKHPDVTCTFVHACLSSSDHVYWGSVGERRQPMARTVRDANPETRTARARLKSRKKPYWRSIDRGLHLGYYRGAIGGAWVGRRYIGDRRYQETTLGTADDSSPDADGLAVLNYSQAQAKARQWFAAEQRSAAGLEEVPEGPFCVRDVAAAYLTWFAEHRKSLDATKRAIEAHILPELGDVDSAKLATTRIRKWHADLAKRPARLRTGRGGAQRYRQPASVPDEIRARRATANRVLTVLKAMLNRAFEEGQVSGDLAWRRVKPFRGVDVARERFLRSRRWPGSATHASPISATWCAEPC